MLFSLLAIAASTLFNTASGQTIPPPAIHPLPVTLTQWHDPQHQGDYFDAISPTGAGYLVWSRFPVTVYVEPVSESEGDRAQEWVEAVTRAVQEWTTYLPLTLHPSPESADITIWRRVPALRMESATEFRARSAETRYQIFLDSGTAPAILRHRFTIQLRPSQTTTYLQAAARHELGHALGIWGHSPLETDALYFSQVRHPALISARDVNTLKRIYQQPTRLGWAIAED